MDYKTVINNQEIAKKLIEDCYFSGSDPVRKWEEARKLVALPFDKEGSVLDIGCANGFLLKSIEHWSNKKLNCYGIDLVESNIVNAKILFPDTTDHFETKSFEEFLTNYPSNFPEAFDYIIWAVWVNHEVQKTEIEYMLKHLRDNGKLILAFYPDKATDPSDILNNEERIGSYNYPLEIIYNIENPNRNEKLVIIRK